MPGKLKKIRFIFITYWFLLAYIIAALVWWYIALNQQNNQMTEYKIHRLNKSDLNYAEQYSKISNEKKRKTAQYLGEGAIFFLLITAGAFFVYRAATRQFKISQQQQHFMIALTHELKTPIAVSKLNLETLQKRKLDELQQQRLLHITLQEANRMNTLCNNMLLSSQIESGGYHLTSEKTDISELLKNCVMDYKSRFPLKMIHTDIENGLFILGDQLMLQMAINNLLDNAIKYTPKESPVSVMLRRNEKHIEIIFTDEGPGIEDKEKKKVFDKYYRVGNEATKRAKGTGLGLYLTDKIIAAHRGKISVTDNIPKGAIFTIELKPIA